MFYFSIFKISDLLNPNGCSAKGTFFVSHKYTNYSVVQEFHRKGHEDNTHLSVILDEEGTKDSPTDE